MKAQTDCEVPFINNALFRSQKRPMAVGGLWCGRARLFCFGKGSGVGMFVLEKRSWTSHIYKLAVMLRDTKKYDWT